MIGSRPVGSGWVLSSGSGRVAVSGPDDRTQLNPTRPDETQSWNVLKHSFILLTRFKFCLVTVTVAVIIIIIVICTIISLLFARQRNLPTLTSENCNSIGLLQTDMGKKLQPHPRWSDPIIVKLSPSSTEHVFLIPTPFQQTFHTLYSVNCNALLTDVLQLHSRQVKHTAAVQDVKPSHCCWQCEAFTGLLLLYVYF